MEPTPTPTQPTPDPTPTQPIAPTPTATAMPVKDKMSKKQILGMAALSVIALAGVLFGIFGMTQSSQKDTEISNLKVQIRDNNGNTTTIDTPEINATTNDGTTVTITDTPVQTVNTKDYIYVGEWGIKIKIPDSLKNVSYSFGYDEQSRPDSISLSVTGVPADFEVEESLPEFATKGKAIAGVVTASQGDCGNFCNYVVFEKGDTKFFYWGPHVAYGADGSNVSDLELGRKTQELIFDMLRNSDNYSEI